MGKLRVSRPSLRHDREDHVVFSDKSEKHPIDTVGWWSYATFSWISNIMYSSYRQPLQPSSIPRISQREACRQNSDNLEQLWTKEMALKNPPRFGHVLWLYARTSVLLTTCVFLVAIILGFFSSVILLRSVLDYASDPNGKLIDGVLRVALLIICEFFRVFFFTLTWALSYRTAIRLKTASMGLVYRKLFRLANINDSYAAKILNLISSDCHRIYEVVVSTQVAIGGPLILTLGAIYIAWELGFISLVGMLVFPLSYPIQFLLAKGSASLKRLSLSAKDSRMMYLTQSLHSLKFLKMFAWEKYFARLITETRRVEKLYLLKSQILHSFSIVLSPMLPHVGAIITFILYINAGNDLTPAQGFTTLFLFSLFSYATRTISRLLDDKHSFILAAKRLEGILVLPEIQSRDTHCVDEALENSIDCDNLTVIRRLSGDSAQSLADKKGRKSKSKGPQTDDAAKLMGSTESEFSTFQIENLTISIKRGSFVGICGHVGSGKSTFLEAIAGSIAYEKGQLSVFGKIAYVPQEPWIFRGTLRDNVTFGEVFEPVRYYNSINSCCLVNDFGNFPAGDLTETKDKGNNLSGGQRQRLSMARALYHFPTRDIYLLDDPFSGLDDRVAKTVFEKVVQEQLWKNKTVLLVTHQMQFLRDCDKILVFSDGRIVEQGTHDELMVTEKSQYASLVAAAVAHHDENDTGDIMLEDSDLLDCGGSNEDALLNQAREKKTSYEAKGEISWRAYEMYIKSAGGPLAVILVLTVFALNIGSTAFSSWWLKSWFRSSSTAKYGNVLATNATNHNISNFADVSSTEIYDDNNMTNLGGTMEPSDLLVININSPGFQFHRDIYAGIIGVIFLTSIIRTLLFVFTSLRASQNIHQKLLVQFFRNRIKSTEKFGTGQVLHLFTRDMAEVDCGLPHSMEFLLQNIFLVISILTMVSTIFPVFLAPLLVLFGIFLLIRRIYNAAIRDLKRFESEAKIPIFTRVTETVTGMGTIRAFGKEQQMINTFESLTDWNNSIFYAFVSAIRWLAFRLDSLAVSVTATTAILVLVFHGRVSPASCGLALSYAAQLSGIFQFTVRMASELEAKFVCVERMSTFLKYSQSEEPLLDNSGGKSSSNRTTIKAPFASSTHIIATHPNWPYAGHLKFDSVTLGYSSSSEPVLKDLSFEIKEGTKLGIIGRTGSGKSSIGNALFRLTELKHGHIYLDSVDISEVSLSKLRNSLCVIPQDAAIFQKSVRFNLDPGNLHSDADLWEVLEKVGLKSSVENLDSEVALSQGQKQMLSIGRAILRQSVLIFVDEATSNVDVETASLMDRLLMQEFSAATVLIVAHRLQALKYCDYLLVMEDGELRDFGPVETITRKPGFLSHFEKFESIPL